MSAKTAQRKQPYSKPKDIGTSSRCTKGAVHTQPSSMASSSTSNASNASTSTSLSLKSSRVARGLYIEFMQEAYPDITPRDDHDLLLLGSTRREGTTAEILAWVDKKMENHINIFGSRKAVMDNAKELLDGIVGMTGVRHTAIVIGRTCLYFDISVSRVPAATSRISDPSPAASTRYVCGPETHTSTNIAWTSWTQRPANPITPRSSSSSGLFLTPSLRG